MTLQYLEGDTAFYTQSLYTCNASNNSTRYKVILELLTEQLAQLVRCKSVVTMASQASLSETDVGPKIVALSDEVELEQVSCKL